MAGWISPNTQILIAILAGVAFTVQEAMYFNFKKGLTEAWRLDIPHGLYSSAFENLLKTTIFVIILIRGVTIHIYLAAYLLMLIPVIMERMRIVILIWLAIAGLRSIIINFAATVVGIFICSSLPRAHPACFNFIGFKGFELGCSAFMWVIVNDFFHYLGRRTARTRRTIEPSMLDLGVQGTSSMHGWHFQDFPIPKTSIRELDEESSTESLYSTITDTVHSIKKRQMRYGRTVADEETDEVIKLAVSRFFENSFGWKYVGYGASDEDGEMATFLSEHREDIETLMENLRNYIKKKVSKGACIHENCSHCNEKARRPAIVSLNKEELQRLSRRSSVYPYHYQLPVPNSREYLTEFGHIDEDHIGDVQVRDLCVEECLLHMLHGSGRSSSVNTSLNNSNQEVKAPDEDNQVETEIQTEPLSNGTLRKIRKQEEILFDQKSDSRSSS